MPTRLDSHLTRWSSWSAPTSTGWRTSGAYTACAIAAARANDGGAGTNGGTIPRVIQPTPIPAMSRLAASAYVRKRRLAGLPANIGGTGSASTGSKIARNAASCAR